MAKNPKKKRREYEHRRVEFPCGYTARVEVRKGSYDAGDDIDRTFSTKKCMKYRRQCTNPEGHAGDKHRLGTSGNPHVEMTCTGCVARSLRDDLEIRWAMNCAQQEWGRDVVQDVYWVEEHVFRTVNAHQATVGYVLTKGAPGKYIQQTDVPWVFLRLP